MMSFEVRNQFAINLIEQADKVSMELTGKPIMFKDTVDKALKDFKFHIDSNGKGVVEVRLPGTIHSIDIQGKISLPEKTELKEHEKDIPTIRLSLPDFKIPKSIDEFDKECVYRNKILEEIYLDNRATHDQVKIDKLQNYEKALHKSLAFHV